MLLQLVDCTVYSADDMKKSIKARMLLSDGNSKITTMVAEKTFNTFAFKPSTFDVVKIQAAKNQLQTVNNNRHVMIIKH